MKFLAVLLLVVAAAVAKPSSDPAESSHTLSDLWKQAQEIGTKIGNELGLESTDSTKVQSFLEENNNKLREALEGLVKTIETEAKAHEGEVNNALKGVEDDLKNTASKLRADHPEAAQHADKLNEEWTKAVNSAVDQLKTLNKQYKPQLENAQSSFKDFMSKIVEAGKDAQKKVEDTLKTHQESH